MTRPVVSRSERRPSRRAVTRTLVGTLSVAGLARSGRRVASAASTLPPAEARFGQEAPDVVFLSNQLTPPVEAESLRATILADYPGRVEFVPADNRPFADPIQAEAAGGGTVGVVGAPHGDFAALAAQGLLADVDGLVTDLAYRNFIGPSLDLARLGGLPAHYLPWMQATYLMAARREALVYLPDGLSAASLQRTPSDDPPTAWAERIAAAAGPRVALVAGPTGLIHPSSRATPTRASPAA